MERLKVFVSSMQTDLQAERDGVQAVIEGLGHGCLRAETYDSPGVSPEEACRQMARDCDIYVGIFGERYGFKPKHLAISVTELEYREARENNPGKICVYVKDVNLTEPDQEMFLRDIQDFSAGYFRHTKF